MSNFTILASVTLFHKIEGHTVFFFLNLFFFNREKVWFWETERDRGIDEFSILWWTLKFFYKRGILNMEFCQEDFCICQMRTRWVHIWQMRCLTKFFRLTKSNKKKRGLTSHSTNARSPTCKFYIIYLLSITVTRLK